jgi:hypothetical protein
LDDLVTDEEPRIARHVSERLWVVFQLFDHRQGLSRRDYDWLTNTL